MRIDFDRAIDGNQVDYIYLDVGVDRKNYSFFIIGTQHAAANRLEDALMKHEYNSGVYLIAGWTNDDGDTNTMRALIENGKVLMPVGSGAGWLNNAHSYVSFWLEKDGSRLDLPEINDVKLYRARDLIVE